MSSMCKMATRSLWEWRRQSIGKAIGQFGIALMFALCRLLPILILFAGVTEVRAEGRRVAFVVGNSDYQSLPTVGSAKSDANRMASALESAGFEVVKITNASKEGLGVSFGKFQSLLDGAEMSLFYYSGHSIQVAKQNRVVPVDMTIAGAANLENQTVGLADILDRMKRKSERGIVIFDACRDIPALSHGAALITPGCAKEKVSAGMLVVLAAEPGQALVDDSLLTDSILSHAFEPGKDINAVLAEVRQDIIEKSDGGQVLYYNSALEEGVTALNPRPAVKTTPQPQTGNFFKDCDDVCPMMAAIPAGSFEMGKAAGEADERPVHAVSIKAFVLGQYEVTIGEWRKCVEAGKCREPSKAQEADDDAVPVHNVTWDDAIIYAEWLSGMTGKRYRLPSEAEWEFAARAGTSSNYSGSDSPSPDFVDCKDCGGTHKSAVPRGKDLKPNSFGLAGMSGGVAEWVMDCWKPSYDKSPANGSAVATANCTQRVLRGGSWRDDRKHVTVTSRAFYDHDVPYPNNGLRIARDM